MAKEKPSGWTRPIPVEVQREWGHDRAAKMQRRAEGRARLRKRLEEMFGAVAAQRIFEILDKDGETND
jgi:hypothetical protein